MKHLRVAVLRGGPSEEYQISMKTGAAVLAALSESSYATKDIIVSQQGEWLYQGLVRAPESILKAIDVVFIALHGAYGENGEVQRILQRLGIPFTGSRAFASARAFNKFLTKETLKNYGVLMPEHREVARDSELSLAEIAKAIEDSFGPEYIIKPVMSGSSFGVEFIPAGKSLEEVLELALGKYERVLIEEFIRGKEATCATLENFRNDSLYIFPTVEIVPARDYQFYTTDSKYDGSTVEICPSRFSYGERSKISEVAALAHDVLDLSQYSRSDFIVNNRGVYFLEVNTLPGLMNGSLYEKSAAAVGLNRNQLIEHLVENATC